MSSWSATRTLAGYGDLGNELPFVVGPQADVGEDRNSIHQRILPPRESAPKPLNRDVRSGSELKGLPADSETAPKPEGFGVQGAELVVATCPINPCEEILVPYPYPIFHDDVRDFAPPDHLVGLAPAKTDYPGNVTDAVKHRFRVVA